jgi:hypothetical protein
VIRLAFACPSCGVPVEGDLVPGTASLACGACGHATPLPEAEAVAETGRVEACPVCGASDLYVQRDFNRPLGLGLAAVGLLLGPFTSWISAAAAVALDAGLYLVVPRVAICHACNAQFRGFEKAASPPPFDIAIHDAYKFAKRHPPRREAAVAGPLRARLRREGKAP